MRALVASVIVALALVLGVAAHGAPLVPGNAPDHAVHWAYGDSIVDRGYRPPYSLYLVSTASGVKGEADSVISAWRAGGATPTFQRIQHISMFQEGGCSPQFLVLDFFTPNGTSANNHFEFMCQLVLDLPVECDSIHVKNDTGQTGQDLDFFVW